MAGHQIEWTGRIDDANDEDSMRWHQKMLSLDLNSEPTKPEPGFCFLGFCSDVGVKRNLGRPGTAKGPASIRGELANLPYGFTARPNLYDAGNIYPEGDDLEAAQMQLAKAVKKIKQLGLFPIVLGGGHEVSHGHYQGLKDHFGRHLGIMNMDAHFDLRPYKNGSSSGTMFRQIADECVRDNAVFEYFPIGIQTYANTPALFKTAKALNCDYILAKDINEAVLADIYERLDDFINRQRHIYLTFDTDVVSSAYAPGVSAPQPFGLNPEISLKIVKHILKSNKVAAFDFVEVSPRFDDDHQTAKLVAVMIYAMINTLS
ncbi:MAG: formimidoylglutamase [Desulfobacterales bacterium]|nr:formimidoylglutamase [Desulfobacterales bacterium]